MNEAREMDRIPGAGDDVTAATFSFCFCIFITVFFLTGSRFEIEFEREIFRAASHALSSRPICLSIATSNCKCAALELLF